MQVTVSGKHLDIGQALREHVETDLINCVTKYFENAVSADVVFTKVRHLFRVDILVNEGTGNHILIKGSSEDDDPYVSFDIASSRIEKQLRRYKSKIKSHSKVRLDKDSIPELIEAKKYVISGEHDSENDNEENDSPLIIAERALPIETITVSDAVMRMDLGQLPAVLFINKKDGHINMVYRRDDGHISWIDSGIEKGDKKGNVA